MVAVLLLVAAQPPLVIPVAGLQPPTLVVPVQVPPLEAPPLILPPVPTYPKPPAPPMELLPPPLKDLKVDPKPVEVPKPAELLPPPLKEFKPDPMPTAPPPPELKPIVVPKPVIVPKPAAEFPKPAPPAPPEKSAAAPPPVKAVEPVLPLPATPTAFSVKATAPDPTPPPPAVRTPTPAPGDTLMPLTVRQMALTAVVSTGLLTAPLLAKEEPKPEPAKAADVLVLKKQVEDLTAVVEQLKKSQNAIREMLEGTERAGDEGLLKAIRKLDAGVAGLDGKLKAFDTKLDAMRTANASPLAAGAAPPTAAGKGTVRIVNEYPIDISMLVNGKPYKLSANTSKDVPVDTGSFKYQLLNSGLNEVVSPVKENETVTLRIK